MEGEGWDCINTFNSLLGVFSDLFCSSMFSFFQFLELTKTETDKGKFTKTCILTRFTQRNYTSNEVSSSLYPNEAARLCRGVISN